MIVQIRSELAVSVPSGRADFDLKRLLDSEVMQLCTWGEEHHGFWPWET